MINQELINYINFHLKKGVFWETIKKDLLDAGWPDADLEENYQQILKEKISASANSNSVYREPIEDQDLTPIESSVNLTNQHQPLEEKPVELFKEETTMADFPSNQEKYNYPEIQENNITPVENYAPEQLNQQERDLGPGMENFSEPFQAEDPNLVTPVSVGKEKPKKNIKVLIISLVLFFLILGGGAFAYYEYVFPQQTFLKALDNFSNNLDTRAMEASQSVSANFVLKPESKTSFDFNNLSLSANLKEEFDFNSEQKLVANASGDINLYMQTKQGEAKKTSASFETRTDDNVIFFLVNSLIGIENVFEFFGTESEMAVQTSQILRENIVNQWISAPISSYQIETYAQIKKIYEEQKQKLDDFYQANRADIIKMAKIKKIGSEKIEKDENDDCFVYQVDFNKEETKKVLSSYLSYFKINTNTGISTDSIFEDDVWPIIEKIKIKLWVTKNDPVFRKYSFAYEENFENDLSVDISSLSINFEGAYKKLNPNLITIYIPESTKTLEQAMETLMQIDYGQSQSTKDVDTKTLLDQASVLANTYKAQNNTYIGFISKGGGADLINQMNNLGGRAAFVYTAKDKYCITKELPDTKESWWCVDSAGYKGLSNNCTKKTYSCE
ncbi:MAG: hypothetical protein WC534_00875 [Candidatus Paceibacterota bacterium]